MADEPKKEHSEDIESVLLGLDAILSDMPDVVPAAPAPPPKVELAPREGMIKPPEKKLEPEKPVPKPVIPLELPPAVAAPSPIVPAPSSIMPDPSLDAVSTKIEELPADTPKDHIRRVAYIYTAACSEAKTTFAAFLSKSARTISKRPLFLREVLSHEIGAVSDPNSVLQKAQQAKAVAILAVIEDWPSVKVQELSEACARANLLFRAVAPAETQKKSTAVDIIVDMMLLSGEG